MKKIFLITVITAFLFSCSSDDDGKNKTDNGGNIPADEKLLEKFSIGNTDFFDFKYNDDKTIKRMIVANAYFFDFKYTGQTISSINIIAEGNSAVYEFSYDQAGKMNGFTINGEPRIVEYNPVENSYLFYEQEDEDRTTIYLNENNDIERYNLDEGINGETNYLFLYDDEEGKKGPMVNTNNIHLYMGMMLSGLVTYAPFVATKPVLLVSLSEGTFECVNEYYSDGFVEQTNFVASNPDPENPPSAGTYKYTKL